MMPGAPDNDAQRPRRGRILLVSERDLSRVVNGGSIAGRSTMQVADLYDAIGAIACATAREPIEAAFICGDLLHTVSDSAVASMRKVDPAVRFFMMNRGAAAPSPETFDAVIDQPLSTAAICQALGEEDDSNGSSGDAASAVQAAPRESTPPSEEHAHELADADAEQAVDEYKADAEADLLGDTDLVEAVLAGADSFDRIALLLIAQQTGWSDVSLKRESSPGALVEHNAQRFGRLAAAGADPAELQQWADWLARWLALEHSHRRNSYMAYHDELTDAWNRRYFNMFLAQSIRIAGQRRRPVTVMVLDIDDFKHYNDAFGHAAGDEILRETVRLLSSVIRKGDRVCRIGGDEFAVIFADTEGPREAGSAHPENVEQIAQRFQMQICKMKFPKLGADAPATLSVSAGLATFPWDGSDPDSLLEHADQLALQSKRKGKNAITLGPGAQQVCQRRDS